MKGGMFEEKSAGSYRSLAMNAIGVLRRQRHSELIGLLELDMLRFSTVRSCAEGKKT